jgi:hypothetical protein
MTGLDLTLYATGQSIYTTIPTFVEKFEFSFPKAFFDAGFRTINACLNAGNEDISLWTRCLDLTLNNEGVFNGELILDWSNPVPAENNHADIDNETATTVTNNSNDDNNNRNNVQTPKLKSTPTQLIPTTPKIIWTLSFSFSYSGKFTPLYKFKNAFTMRQHLLKEDDSPNSTTETALPFTVSSKIAKYAVVYPSMIDDSDDNLAHFTIHLSQLLVSGNLLTFSYVGDACLFSDPKLEKLNQLFGPYQRSFRDNHNDGSSSNNNNIDIRDINNHSIGFETLTIDNTNNTNNTNNNTTPNNIGLNNDELTKPTCSLYASRPVPVSTKCLINGSLHEAIITQSDPSLFSLQYELSGIFIKGRDYVVQCYNTALRRFSIPVDHLAQYQPKNLFSLQLLALRPQQHLYGQQSQQSQQSPMPPIPPIPPSIQTLSEELLNQQLMWDNELDQFESELSNLSLRADQNPPAQTIKLDTRSSWFHPSSDFSSSEYRPVLISPVMANVGQADEGIFAQFQFKMNGNKLDPLDTFSCTFIDGLDRSKFFRPIDMGDIYINVTTVQSISQWDANVFKNLYNAVNYKNDRDSSPGSFTFRFARLDHEYLNKMNSFTITIQTNQSSVAIWSGTFQLSCQFYHDELSFHFKNRSEGDSNNFNTLTQIERPILPPLFERLSRRFTVPAVAESMVQLSFGQVTTYFEKKRMDSLPKSIGDQITTNNGYLPVILDEFTSLYNYVSHIWDWDIQNNDDNNINHNNNNKKKKKNNNNSPEFSPQQIVVGRTNFTIHMVLSGPTEYPVFQMYLAGNVRFGGGWHCDIKKITPYGLDEQTYPIDAQMRTSQYIDGAGFNNELIQKYHFPLYQRGLSIVDFTDMVFWSNDEVSDPSSILSSPSSSPNNNDNNFNPQQYSRVINEISCQSAFAIAQTWDELFLPSYIHIQAVDKAGKKYSFGSTFHILQTDDQDLSPFIADIPKSFKIFALSITILLSIVLFIGIVLKVLEYRKERQILHYFHNTGTIVSAPNFSNFSGPLDNNHNNNHNNNNNNNKGNNDQNNKNSKQPGNNAQVVRNTGSINNGHTSRVTLANGMVVFQPGNTTTSTRANINQGTQAYQLEDERISALL